MKTLSIALAAALWLAAAPPAHAQTAAGATADSHSHSHPTAAASESAATWSEGEITRWDPRTLKLTLKHGEIKNLEMPPMTMVFRVADAGVLGDLKPGDKVRFQAEKRPPGTYHVTHIEKAP